MKNALIRLREWFRGRGWIVQTLIVGGLLIFIGLTAVTVSATTWEYTNSPEFCGTVCHTMPPEYAAYQVSPHARVDCVDCHLGQDSFLMTVPRKAREVRHVINALTQAYEPPIYVKSLRPAEDTCEQCHNPDKFSNDTFVEIKRYAEDEENTEQSNFLVVKTGGGSHREGLGRGIHWHIENDVYYYTDDPLKQTIPYVKVVYPDGSETEFFDVEAGLPANFGTEVEDELRNMDCLDCHNRVSHLFRSPEDAMDDALARNAISHDIPEIKKRGVEILSEEYETTEEGLETIEALDEWYQTNYPDYYAENQDVVEDGINELKTIFELTVFPNMEVGWETHPSNDGHRDFPGCFRCHDGKHTSPEQETIRLECNLCHSIPEIVDQDSGQVPLVPVSRADEPESHLDSNWIARHRYEFDMTCAECHDVSNPGGTDNSSFCANSGCHATEWKYVGLNAPAIREMVAPPRVPGASQPRPIPHPAGEQTDCDICHAQDDGVIPVSASHEGFDQSLCIFCHEATNTDLAGEVARHDLPEITHLVEGFEDQCLVCHELDATAPYPESHAAWSEDSCLFCHEPQSEEIEAESDERRPSIKHTLEGREDCLFCHGLDSIEPFPENHEGRDVEKCTTCHKSADEDSSS